MSDHLKHVHLHTLCEYVVIPTPNANPPTVASPISSVTANVYPFGMRYRVTSATVTFGSTRTLIDVSSIDNISNRSIAI
jgi:hypothetical protein